MTLVVSEIFGPTIQGEGPSTGRLATFLRLGRCNLSCGAGDGAAWACDTPYTWDWQGKLGTKYDPAVELRRMDVDDVAAQIVETGARLLVISGGEPMLQQRGLIELLDKLPGRIAVEIETNGTQTPDERIAVRCDLNVSPKLSSSGMLAADALRPAVLAELRDAGARFKFVIGRPSDLAEVDELVRDLRLDPSNVWVMPAGTTAEAIGDAQALAAAAIERRWNFSTRLHVLLWGDRRGV